MSELAAGRLTEGLSEWVSELFAGRLTEGLSEWVSELACRWSTD